MIEIKQIEKAVKVLKSGCLVAFPTETVYGLGADARNAQAVLKVFQAKNRPHHHPLIVHIESSAELHCWAQNISAEALLLADAFWPGPITLVFKKRPEVLDIVTGGQDTIALRVPRHPVAQALLKAFGGGLVGPSANLYTYLSPTFMQAVQDDLRHDVDFILDGGDCEIGLESTIIDVSGVPMRPPTILRPGMITQSEIEGVLKKRNRIDLAKDIKDIKDIKVPGMHRVHYAPKTQVCLVEQSKISATLTQLIKQVTTQVTTQGGSKQKRIVLLAFNPLNERLSKQFANQFAVNIEIIQMPSLARDYAHHLYRLLRNLDQKQYECIVIEMVPNDESFTAIRDRLLKASARS